MGKEMTSPTVGRRREGSDITASQSLAASWQCAGFRMDLLLSLFLVTWPGLSAFRSMCPINFFLLSRTSVFYAFLKNPSFAPCLILSPPFGKKIVIVWDVESNTYYICHPEAWYFFGVSSTKINFSCKSAGPSSYLLTFFSEPVSNWDSIPFLHWMGRKMIYQKRGVSFLCLCSSG